MLQRSVFKRRRLLRKSEINKLLHEQDYLSFQYLRETVSTGRVEGFRDQKKTDEADTLRIVLIRSDTIVVPSHLRRKPHEDVFIGVTDSTTYEMLVRDCPEAYVLHFENIEPDVMDVEFCKILSQIKKIREYSYLLFDDMHADSIDTSIIIQEFQKRKGLNTILWAVEYKQIKGVEVLWSDLSGPKSGNWYKLKFPLRNVPTTTCFITDSHTFQKINFEKYTFAIRASLFYSCLASSDCFMTPDFAVHNN